MNVLDITLLALVIVFVTLYATKKTSSGGGETCIPYVVTWTGTSLSNDGSFSTFTVPQASCGVTLVVPDDDLSSLNFFYYAPLANSISNVRSMYVSPWQPANLNNRYTEAYFRTNTTYFTSGTSFSVVFSSTLASPTSVSFGWNND